MNVLCLPIPDGSVPKFEQLQIFLEHAQKTIKQGRKVAVHCQVRSKKIRRRGKNIDNCRNNLNID